MTPRFEASKGIKKFRGGGGGGNYYLKSVRMLLKISGGGGGNYYLKSVRMQLKASRLKMAIFVYRSTKP